MFHERKRDRQKDCKYYLTRETYKTWLGYKAISLGYTCLFSWSLELFFLIILWIWFWFYTLCLVGFGLLGTIFGGFWSQVLGLKIFVDQKFMDTDIFCTNIFWVHIFFGPQKCFRTPIFLWTQSFWPFLSESLRIWCPPRLLLSEIPTKVPLVEKTRTQQKKSLLL